MMEDGLLSLKWNNHKVTFFEILRTLREKSHYTDATIAVEGKFYSVHKLVMSTCSEYFQDIFARTPCKSPVIVLKDVRSQDMDALLDYMYLGEVNVNQNDLASLLKTAECLRIKGLAVPDEDPTKLRKAPSDERHDTPPPKRRRHEDVSRPVSPPASAPTKTPTPLSSPLQPPPPICSQASPDHLDTDPPPHIVKVEMQEPEPDDGYRHDSYEGSVNEEGGGEYGAEVSKAEHDPESYGSGSFPGPSLQPGGDLAWEEGDSSSFPPESYSGDVPAGQQPQGDNDNDDDDDDDPLNTSGDGMGMPGSSIPSSAGSPQCPPPLTPISQARQCQLCLVTLANANLLRRHVEDHHFHIRKYNCAHCGKKFKRKEHKERHERIHTGEKPFVCHICNARFTQKEHLKGHVENVHHKHGEKGLDILGDMDKDVSEQDEKDDDMDISISSPPSSSAGSPSLAPVSSLMTIATSPSPITTVLPISSNSSTSLVSAETPALLPSANSSSSSSAVTSMQIIPTSLPNDVGVNQLTALYAPVTRKTVNSPNKHMQTITINFN